MSVFDDARSLIGGIFNGPAANIAADRVDVPGGYFIVSTIDSSDMGPETAIIERDHTLPVERYDSVENAIVGHAAWVERMKANPSKLMRVGYGDSIPDEEFDIKPIQEGGQ